MAIVDSLLQLVSVRNADALILPAGQVPFLERQGEQCSLSMPVPGSDVVEAILGEVASAPQRKALSRGGLLTTQYRSADDTVFAVKIEAAGDGYNMAFRLAAGSASAQPSPTPPLPPPAADPPQPASRSASAYRAAGGADFDPTSIAEAVDHCLRREASDLIISTGNGARLRVGGELIRLDAVPCQEADLLAFLEPALSPGHREQLEAAGSCDLAFERDEHRFRVNLFRQQHGLAAAFRPIKRDIPTLQQLNLPDDLYQLTSLSSGLVLMVGTTGSGKSTTLVALIEQLNRTAAKHIITLEDPIEYSYVPRKSLIHQRELGMHVDSFSSGLRAALRECPDVILLGEMRDRATIAAALTAAETGHLVLSTLHSGNATMAIHRMVDSFPEHQQMQVRQQLADVLRAVVTQYLLPSSSPPMRVPAYEKLMVTTAVSTKIRENRCHQIGTELQRDRAEGMIPLELSLARLVRRKLLSMSTAVAQAPDRTLLEQLVVRG